MQSSPPILSSHLFLPKGQVDLDDLKERLTARSLYDDEVEIPMYVEGSMIGVPRHFYDRLPPGTIDATTPGKPIHMDFTSSLRPAQVPLIRQFIQERSDGATGFIVEAPPGFGKTVVIVKLLSVLQSTALVVVPRSNLVDQWVERLLEHSTLIRDDIGVVCGDTYDWKGRKVVVGLVHTLALDRCGELFRERFGVTVYDEVDRSVPPATFAPVVGMFPSKYRIGASATVRRKDGMDVVFRYHIGQVWLKGEDVGRMSARILVHHYPEDSGYVHKDSAKLNRRGMLLTRVSENPERNELILKYIRMLVASTRRTLVLSDRTKQLQALYHALGSRASGFYVHSLEIDGKRKKVPKKELEKTARDKRVILATYGMVAIGTDIPDLAGLVYATPQSDIKQAKGRIERMATGKRYPIVVDIVDDIYEDAVNWWYARSRIYREERLIVKEYYGRR